MPGSCLGAAERGGGVAGRPQQHPGDGERPGEPVPPCADRAGRGEHAADGDERRIENGLGGGGDGVAAERGRERLREENARPAKPASASRRTLRPPSGAIHLIASLLP